MADRVVVGQGQTSAQVAQVTGYSLTWIRTIARRYQTEGETGIGDRRHGNPGGKRRLTAEQEAALDRALERVAPNGGLWTAKQVAAWITERTGRWVSVVCGWEYLRRLDRRRYRPRPRHAKADAAAQEAFKKTG